MYEKISMYDQLCSSSSDVRMTWAARGWLWLIPASPGAKILLGPVQMKLV